MSLLTTSETSDITSLSSLASGSSLACETRWGSAVFDLMPYLSIIATSKRACVGVVSSTLSAVSIVGVVGVVVISVPFPFGTLRFSPNFLEILGTSTLEPFHLLHANSSGLVDVTVYPWCSKVGFLLSASQHDSQLGSVSASATIVVMELDRAFFSVCQCHCCMSTLFSCDGLTGGFWRIVKASSVGAILSYRGQ
ncbi:hypothetical protein Tco_0749377 [Tanacetum coccineum]|uniref:Uncharacterized protein n=1 Tax=Tanacetum coccineum TaxID=301880 RepID=A0ABQ4YZ83_9ASTR